MMNRKTVTVILPAFNEADSIALLERKMNTLAADNGGYTWQFLIIDDGSTDATLRRLRDLSSRDQRFQYLSLSRNFGKENAVLAGLDYADGDAVIIMDSDMQHPIEVIPQMLERWEEGVQNVFAKRRTSRESWFKRNTSKVYYRLLNSFSDVPIDLDAGDFRLLDRRCVDALRGMREHNRNNKSLFCWIGYDKDAVEYDQLERTTGSTKFSASGLFLSLIHI